MTTKFMRDRVAEAIARAAMNGQDFGGQAIAALQALREPTEAMKDVGAPFVYEGWASQTEGQKVIATESWQAMVDEALK